MKFDLDDIQLEPCTVSDINSRSEIDIYTNEYTFLPLIGAPMDTVFDRENCHKGIGYLKIGICIPRGEDFNKFNGDVFDMYHKIKGDIGSTYTVGSKVNHITPLLSPDMFLSLSMREFQSRFLVDDLFFEIDKIKRPIRILIDTANGHMNVLHDMIKKSKDKLGDKLIIMAGNVATPMAYKTLSDAGADYVRLGIGGGSACLTSVQTGVGYPMGSLIHESYEISLGMENPAKIIADGGFRTYADIIKALALGANYVMIGGILNKCLEAHSRAYFLNIPVPNSWKDVLFDMNIPLYHKYRGMSTKEVQKDWGAKSPKTAEGITKKNKIEYRFTKWSENFEHYLRSAMSYTGCRSLKDFVGYGRFNIITENTKKRYDK